LNAAAFLVRCLADFPERVRDLQFLQPRVTAGLPAMRSFATACPDIARFLAQRGEWERVDTLLEHLVTFRTQVQNDREIALQEAKAVFTLTEAALAAKQWTRARVMLKRFDDLRTNMLLDDPIVALAESHVILETVHAAGSAGEWGYVDPAFDCLENVLQRAAHKSDHDLMLQDVYVTAAATLCATQAGEWDKVEARLHRLTALCAQKPLCDDRELAHPVTELLSAALVHAAAATES
jgi:hypothetical protein